MAEPFDIKRVEPSFSKAAPTGPSSSKPRRSGKSIKSRLIMMLVMLLPLLIVAGAIAIVMRMHKPQPLNRQHITPVLPAGATAPAAATPTVTKPVATTPAKTTTKK